MKMNIKYEMWYCGSNGWWKKDFQENEIDMILYKLFYENGCSNASIEAVLYDENDFRLGNHILFKGYTGFTKEYLLNNCIHYNPYCELICQKITNFLQAL